MSQYNDKTDRELMIELLERVDKLETAMHQVSTRTETAQGNQGAILKAVHEIEAKLGA